MLKLCSKTFLALREPIVDKLVILGILFLTSFILQLREVLVAKLVRLSILSSRTLILALFTSFLTTSFLLHHLVYLNQQEKVLIYQHLIYLLYSSTCLNYLVYFFNLSISNLSSSDFKLVKSTFLANLDASTSVAFFKSTFFLQNILVLENIHSLILCLFYQSSY